MPRQAFGGALITSIGMWGISRAYSLARYYRVPAQTPGAATTPTRGDLTRPAPLTRIALIGRFLPGRCGHTLMPWIRSTDCAPPGGT